jgi:restriction endonuclease S subunit
MSEFLLNDTVDKEKVFLINLSEIEGRIDPHPYHPERKDALKKLEALTCVKLRNVVKSNKKITQTILEEDVYLGLENIQSGTGEYLKTNEKGSISSAAIFNKGQILFPKLRPYLNKVHYAEFDGLCSTEFHVFDAIGLKPYFLFIYLQTNLFVSQTILLMTGKTLPRLQTDDISKIPVPIIPENLQDLIIKKYQDAQYIKHQKETQAKQLLTSIDEYLLNELGITLPEKDNSLENRIFTTSLSKVSGNRFDCDYYSIHYSNLENSISKSVYLVDKIATVVSNIASGKTAASSEYSDVKTEYPIIKVGSYSAEYIDLEKTDYTKSANNIEAHKGDIFILSAAHQAEYVGRFIKYLDEEPKIPTAYVGELICVRANKKVCNSMYLFSLLSLDVFKTLINREKTGQTSHVYGKDIKHIKIPTPPIEKQNEIAVHIRQIRDQAKQLQKEAVEELEKAKQGVEQIILGTK